MRKIAGYIVIIGLLLTSFSLNAQDTEILPTPQRVEVTDADGVVLVGDFYTVPDGVTELPTVILLHGQGSERSEWIPLTTPLLEHGFNVLAVDQRAFGESGGQREMLKMIDDIQLWMDWLRQQPTVLDNGISTIGSSMGTVPALGGCAADAECVTAIAISPGDFPTLDEDTFSNMSERSLLYIVGRQDNVYFDTQKLFDRASGEAAMIVYNTATHGSTFFTARNSFKPRVTALILNWLEEHLPALQATRHSK